MHRLRLLQGHRASASGPRATECRDAGIGCVACRGSADDRSVSIAHGERRHALGATRSSMPCWSAVRPGNAYSCGHHGRSARSDEDMKVEAGFSALDLLLSLIERRQIDICEVSIAQIADDYLDHVLSLDWLDIDEAAEFLVVAASLLYIKVRALLPAAGQQPEPTSDEADGGPDGEGEDDPAHALVARLIEYRRFRDAARALRPLEAAGLRAYAVRTPLPKPAPAFIPPEGLTAQALARACLQAVSSLPQEFEQAPSDEIPMAQQMVAILSRLARRGKLRLQDLFGQAIPGRHRGITLALLELARRGRVNAEQPVPFGDIWVTPSENQRSG